MHLRSLLSTAQALPRDCGAGIAKGVVCAIVVLFALTRSISAQGLAPLKVPAAVYEMNEDGTGWKKVISPGDYTRIGSLRLSPDGSRLCFDGIKAGQPWSAAVLLSCRLDGSDLKVHGTGAMPNFSPDLKKISYCSYGEYAVRVRNLEDGMDSAVEEGWGVQWSPVSSEIAYVINGGTVVIRNMETGERRPLFPAEGSPYQSVSYNMAWSHDGKQLAIQGQRPGGAKEIAVVDAHGAELGFTVICPMQTISNCLAFHPNGRTLAFQSYLTGNKCSQLFTVDVKAGSEPQRMPGQTVDFDNVSLAWIEGGRKVRVVSWQR
jgi:Tol biopolymer transport system component